MFGEITSKTSVRQHKVKVILTYILKSQFEIVVQHNFPPNSVPKLRIVCSPCCSLYTAVFKWRPFSFFKREYLSRSLTSLFVNYIFKCWAGQSYNRKAATTKLIQHKKTTEASKALSLQQLAIVPFFLKTLDYWDKMCACVCVCECDL